MSITERLDQAKARASRRDSDAAQKRKDNEDLEKHLEEEKARLQQEWFKSEEYALVEEVLNNQELYQLMKILYVLFHELRGNDPQHPLPEPKDGFKITKRSQKWPDGSVSNCGELRGKLSDLPSHGLAEFDIQVFHTKTPDKYSNLGLNIRISLGYLGWLFVPVAGGKFTSLDTLLDYIADLVIELERKKKVQGSSDLIYDGSS